MENLFLILFWLFIVWLIAVFYGGGGGKEVEKEEPKESCPLCGEDRKKSKNGYGFFIIEKLPSEKKLKKAN